MRKLWIGLALAGFLVLPAASIAAPGVQSPLPVGDTTENGSAAHAAWLSRQAVCVYGSKIYTEGAVIPFEGRRDAMVCTGDPPVDNGLPRKGVIKYCPQINPQGGC